MRPTRKLMKADVSILLDAVDPLIDYPPGDAESLYQFGNGGSVQLVVFEESLSLFHDGNIFPGHELQVDYIHTCTAPEGNEVPGLDILQLRDVPIRVMDIKPHKILKPFVAVESTSALPHLSKPRPYPFRRSIDRNSTSRA